jgi:YD repeat-containing protein
MKAILSGAILLISLSSSAQYYYKDIIGTRESSDIVKNYMKNRVSRVILTSYDVDDVKSDDFFVEQEFSNGVLKTITRSSATNASTLLTYADANGNVVKTVDSSDIVVSTTLYSYNGAGQLVSILSTSSDTSSNESEEHLWTWNENKPARMLRIKNKVDTTYVDFKFDEAGNLSEETETHKRVRSQPVYYYYNENNQLTDIVRYSERAKQLLPEYMFEYSAAGQEIQKITVPSNNSDYLIWRYQYNPQGLKIKEVVYSKYDKRNPMGKVEYQYSFR